MTVTPPVLMIVTDPGIPDLVGRLSDAISGGATAVLYRDKAARTEERVRWLRAFREGFPDIVLIVNGDAKAVDDGLADGLHLPSDMIGLAGLEGLFHPDKMVGRSVHPGFVEPDLSAHPMLDYVLFGTVFQSESHPGGSTTGISGLKHACASTSSWGEPNNIPIIADGASCLEAGRIPVIAIGGIDAANAGDCVRAGARGVAVIRSVLTANDPARAAADILKSMREAV